MTLNKPSCLHCPDPALARNLCSRHYQQWRKATPPALRPPLTPETRFWAKVDRNGTTPLHAPELGNCWIWTNASHHWGYGKLRRNKKDYAAHRLSYEMEYGPIPAGLLVLHRCDNPPCVRPTHLRLGTSADNTRDMHDKGRAANEGALGMANSHAKLTDAQVLEIRERFDRGELIRRLALEFGVGRTAISHIVNGHNWKHLGGPIREPRQIGRRPRKEAA